MCIVIQKQKFLIKIYFSKIFNAYQIISKSRNWDRHLVELFSEL